jgi:hypothetical protein
MLSEDPFAGCDKQDRQQGATKRERSQAIGGASAELGRLGAAHQEHNKEVLVRSASPRSVHQGKREHSRYSEIYYVTRSGVPLITCGFNLNDSKLHTVELTDISFLTRANRITEDEGSSEERRCSDNDRD